MFNFKKNCLLYIIIAILSFVGINNSFADGFIVAPRPELSEPFPLEVKYHHVNVEVKGETSVTYIDQEFFNSTNQRLEGYYFFPIPKNAVIKKFSMFIDGKEAEAELLDAKKAKEIYEDIVRRQLDPALLEYIGLALFKVRIFPIEPNSTKRVKISYTEILNRDSGTIEYLYPLNTEKFSSKPLQDVVINVNIRSEDNIKNIYCTTHEVDVVRKNEKHAIISYEAKNVKPDRDFKIYYDTDRSKLGLSLLTYREKGDNGYFFLSASPGFSQDKEEVNKKDITFVLDVSGSMAGEKLDQAKKALLFCIENLNKKDRFEIIKFSTEAEALFSKLADNDEKNIKKAKKFIKELKAIGGTNIEEALKFSLSSRDNGSRSHMIIFITDGKPTIGETKEELLLKGIKKSNISNTRIFTFGIGYELNTHLLDRITDVTRAYRTYISPEEDLEIKISNFYNKVQSAVLTDIKLEFANIKIMNIYPKHLPDLFKGSSFTILGRYKGDASNAKIVIKGKVKDKEVNFDFKGDFPAENLKNDFIPPLWAARRIGYLLDQIRLNGEDKELIDEITQLARKFGIVTPYTSYLILEDEADMVRRGYLDDEYQTLGNIKRELKDFSERSKKDYFGMREKSGKNSVQASEELQALNEALNYDQTIQGESRMNFKDNTGNITNITQQVKNVQGRAIYNSGEFWVDSMIQEKRKANVERIKFASKKYFDLIKEFPESAQFLSLGKKVRFFMNNKIYEIFE